MNLGDYLLPWKAIPNMVKDVKAASKTTDEDGKKNYDSIFGAIGKYADPGGALFGDNWMDFWHGTVPREMNRAAGDFSELHREYLDPIWQFGGKEAMGGEEGDFYKITDTKSGDISAAIMAMVLGGMALGGAGAASGSSGGQAAAGTSSLNPAPQTGFWNSPNMPFNWQGMDWTDPNTYMRMSRMMPGQQQQQQQQFQMPDIYTAMKERQKKMEEELAMQKIKRATNGLTDGEIRALAMLLENGVY